MLKLISLLSLTLIAADAHSQNIYSALRLNEQREYKTSKPIKIIETNIFYTSTGKEVHKNIKTFDGAGMILTETRFDEEGSLTARLSYTNDTTNKITLTRVFERWNRFGSSRETAFYEYDSNHFLTRITDKNAMGNVLRRSEIVNNEKGDPTALTLFDGNGNSFGTETALYFYERNKVLTTAHSGDGTPLSSDTITISFKNASLFPGPTDSFNEKGDRVSWLSKNLDGKETLFEEEYVYDKFGNCTENRIFKVTVKANGKHKREIDRIFKKEYFY